jgi:hypothetical protein
MPERPLPTEPEVRALIHDRRNWGRWGKDDQLGAINLITPSKRAAAARLVRTGRSVSLSRPFPKEPGLNNALPAHHYMRMLPRGKGGFAADYYGIFYHGVASTHIDALCHTWDEQAMWNGRDPKKEITFDGATFGSVEHWSEGILTRAVMLDVPRHRGVGSVTEERPVHGWSSRTSRGRAACASSRATRSASTRGGRPGRPRTRSGRTGVPSGPAPWSVPGCTSPASSSCGTMT